MPYPQSIQKLIEILTKLPTVGPKTAERYVFYLLQQESEELQKFAQAIAELKEKTLVCQTCFAVADQSPCENGAYTNTDNADICNSLITSEVAMGCS